MTIAIRKVNKMGKAYFLDVLRNNINEIIKVDDDTFTFVLTGVTGVETLEGLKKRAIQFENGFLLLLPMKIEVFVKQ